MGTTFKRGKKWGISVIDSHGRQIRKMVSSYKETAERILKKIETEIVEGKYLDIKKYEKIFFEDFASEYIKTHVRLELKNPRNQEYMINCLATQFRGKYLHQIDALMIRQHMARRLRVVRPASVNREFQTLKSMFNRAIEWGMYSGSNPAVGIKNVPQNNSRCRWLTEEEQERLLSCCSNNLTRVIILVALKTGMRWGEIVTLKWKQAACSNYVDFDNGVIFVHESLAKSQRSRHIPLSDAVRMALQGLERIPNTDYIFYNPTTLKPMGSLKRSFHTALRRAKISNFRFHDLRHTFASQLVRCGVDLYVVQKLLGHTSPKMTQRYAHLRSDQLKEAIERIDMQSKNNVYHADSNNSTFLAHSDFDKKQDMSNVL
ncbi:MAG: site-specific integrase [Candidatus Omnitrophica bacterium]|nr:site-specific integrase [Candidatus Omnitrophota bacterium]